MPRVYPGLTRGSTGEAEDRRLQGEPRVFPPLGPLFRLHEGVQGLLEGLFREALRRLQGAAGRTTRERMAEVAVENLLAVLEGREPPNPVV